MKAIRKRCPMRHPDNGNCSPAGGFCTAINDSICEALHSAYDLGGFDFSRRAKMAQDTYPELAMYDAEDYRLDLWRDNPAIDGPDYEVVFEVADERYYCFLHGTESLLEALGLFFRDNPHITYDMIFEHMEV